MYPSLSKVLLTAILVLVFETTVAEEPKAAQPAVTKSVCETMDGFNDWDFWLGEWKVYSNDDKRVFQGTNRISKHHKNCLIMENWTSAQGGDGRSMNYYDPVENQWRQLWVAGGYSIDYTGGLDESGAMVLNGKINYYEQDESFDFRGRWTPNEDGSVRQFFEQFDPEKKAWNVWFDGLYIKP
jgi:hypothetical protein